nr:hypothetical protein bcere0006_54870 [Bacillus wiedmannii]
MSFDAILDGMIMHFLMMSLLFVILLIPFFVASIYKEYGKK